MMRKLSILFFMLFSKIAIAQYTSIPDVNFERALISKRIDKGLLDGRVLTSDIEKVTQLYLNDYSIKSLTGIEAFSSLQVLECKNNLLSIVNFEKNTLLLSLSINGNQIENIDISKNTNLTYFEATNNKISTIDFSKNPKLTVIKAGSNNLSQINTINNVELLSLDFTNNKISSIDISKNNLLKILNCSTNQLVNLDLSKNINLKYLWCSNNFINTLSLNNNTQLLEVDCKTNKIAVLEISKAEDLLSLDCSNNILSTIDVSSNTKLNIINCKNNSLSKLIVSKNLLLNDLNCESNLITDLDISANIELKKINCSSNKLNYLELSKNLNLLEINCSNNLLKELEVSNKFNLSSINLSNNKIANFKISSIPSLVYLDFSNNNIEKVSDLEYLISLKTLKCNNNYLYTLKPEFSVLESLDCSSNNIKYLDLTKNAELKAIKCNNNPLLYLNLKSGKNSNLTEVDFRNCPNLKCITVDDSISFLSKWSSFKDPQTVFSTNLCESSKINIPDTNFEDALISLGIDTDGKNGYVYFSSIRNISSLDVNNKNITDLTGIEYFENLSILICENNKLTKLSTNNNRKLSFLNVNKNSISNIDITKNNELRIFYCNQNNLKSIDLSKNSKLENIYCSDNQLEILDFSNNPLLVFLECSNNKLATLDFSFNSALFSLNCANNQIKSIDLTKNVNLKSLYIKNNILTSLNLSNNPLLSNLFCGFNFLKNLNLTKNVNLTYLNCENNILSVLDVSKNKLLTSIDCKNNKLVILNLKNSNNSNITAPLLFNNPSLNCITVDDANYSNSNWKFSKDNTCIYSSTPCVSSMVPIPDSEFENALIAANIDTDGKNGNVYLSSVAFLEDLSVSNKNIVNLSGIEYFYNLNTLKCDNNKIVNLDLSKNVGITSVDCSNNFISTLDLSSNFELRTIKATSNNLIVLNLKNRNNFKFTKDLNFTNNTYLYCIQVDDSNYANTNWTNFKDSIASFNTTCSVFENDNFNVTTQAEKCPGASNGYCVITTKKKYNYTAEINGKSYKFTNTLNLDKLAPGTYVLKVAIENSNFLQNFEITIPKATIISGKTIILDKEIFVEVSEGMPPFNVIINGNDAFITSKSFFNVSVNPGDELIVRTSSPCQGELKASIPKSMQGFELQPNPTSGNFSIITDNEVPNISVSIYTATGILKSKGSYSFFNGRLDFNIQDYASGIYVVKIGDTNPQVIKVVKY